MTPLILHAGPMQLSFQPTEGSIRYLYAGGHEVLRGLAAPIRDRAWSTVLPEISDLVVDQRADAFEVTFTARCRAPALDFRWHGKLSGVADGTVVFDFAGEALCDLQRNRIGFCVLHGAELSGRACSVEHTNGQKELGHFPTSIQTGAPFSDIRALTHDLAPGLAVEVRMEGETFEMEDQRNWTDASFKTYCTLQSLPRPVLVTEGTRLQQRVTIRLRGAVPGTPINFTPPWQAPREVQVTIGQPLTHPLPALGTVWNSTDGGDRVIASLRSLAMAHLRVDLWLNERTYPQKLRSAARAATQLDAALELAVFVDDNAAEQFAQLHRELRALPQRPRIARWLVFHEARDATPVASIAAVRAALAGSPFHAPVGGGSVDNFTELNYHPAVTTVADLTTHACNPQVHAFDPASMVETLAIQGLTAVNARQLSCGRPVAISPITLPRRWRLSDTGAPTGRPAGLLPFQVDPRQTSPFAAAWTLGSLAALAREGVASATYFEATGDNGLLAVDGAARPLVAVFAAVAPFAGAMVVSAESSHPLVMTALAVERDGQRLLLLANFRDQPQAARVTGQWGERALTVAAYSIGQTFF